MNRHMLLQELIRQVGSKCLKTIIAGSAGNEGNVDMEKKVLPVTEGS